MYYYFTLIIIYNIVLFISFSFFFLLCKVESERKKSQIIVYNFNTIYMKYLVFIRHLLDPLRIV